MWLGAPILEAIGNGIPIIATDSSSNNSSNNNNSGSNTNSNSNDVEYETVDKTEYRYKTMDDKQGSNEEI